MNKIPFLAMFFEYRPSEELQPVLEQAEILHAEIRQDQRKLSLQVAFPTYLSDSALREVKNELLRIYGLRDIEIHGKFPAEDFPKLDGMELSRLMIKQYSPCSAILAGCHWNFGEETTLSLVANGKDEILPILPMVERYVFDRFGVQTGIRVETNRGN